MKKTLSLIFTFIFGLVGNVCATQITWSSNGHSYEAISVGQFISWEDAASEANAMGGYLATITSPEENAFVWDLVDNLNYSSYWLGGYQEAPFVEPAGSWRWVTDETWIYTNWYPGEPNNGMNGTQNYLHFWLNNGFWDDMENGRYMAGYIVENNPVPEPTTLLLISAGLAGVAMKRRRK